MLKDRKEKLSKLQQIPNAANYAKDQVQIATGLQQIEELLRNHMVEEKQTRDDHDEKLRTPAQEKEDGESEKLTSITTN